MDIFTPFRAAVELMSAVAMWYGIADDLVHYFFTGEERHG